MSKTLDMSAVQNEQKALLLLADEIQKCDDDDTRELLAAEIQKSAEKLQALCNELQAEADSMAQDAPKPNTDAVVEVVLTKDQRALVLEKTGLDVPSIRIPDPNADLTRNMKDIDPDFILDCALKQADKFKRFVAESEEEA